MNRYLILIPSDEAAWERTGAEERAAVYAKHEQFAKLLAERGHTMTGGAELHPAREAWAVRASGVTEGPYAETVEQLSGFYLVDTDDVDDLLEACGVLTSAEGGLEVRRVVTGEEREGGL